MLSAKNITRKSIEYEKIIDIYQQSFPENEKYPMWLLLLMSYRKSVDFLAFYDKEVFCGFIYLIHYDNMTFVLYLATDGNIRSKGYVQPF